MIILMDNHFLTKYLLNIFLPKTMKQANMGKTNIDTKNRANIVMTF